MVISFEVGMGCKGLLYQNVTVDHHFKDRIVSTKLA
jgi:hypothetical protein